MKVQRIQCTKNISTALLWAAAILASALLGSSEVLTLMILPALAAVSVLQLNKPGTL